MYPWAMHSELNDHYTLNIFNNFIILIQDVPFRPDIFSRVTSILFMVFNCGKLSLEQPLVKHW